MASKVKVPASILFSEHSSSPESQRPRGRGPRPQLIRQKTKFGFTLAMPRERSTLRSRRAVSFSEGGFTLVELLIAAAITVVIVVLLGTMLGSLLNTASHASQRVDAFRDARAALQMMERDLSSLVPTQWDIRSSPVPTPTPTPITQPAAYFALDKRWQDTANDPYSDPTNGNPNRQIFGLIATKSAGSLGDMCAVGYYCRWEGNRYTLRRFFRNSAATFTVFKNAANYVSDADLYTPSASDDVLATNVWNFNIGMYDDAGNPISTYPYVCDPSGTYAPSAAPPTPNPLPAAIEISFSAMSPQAARTVMSVSTTPNDWMVTTTQNYQRLIQAHAYTFRTRINLQ